MAAELPEKLQVEGSLVRQYAAQCGAPDAADLVQFLEQHPDAALHDRVGVVLFDQYHHWRQGELVPAEHYLELFPEIAADRTGRLELIVEEFAYRCEAGENPTVEEYTDRFPELSDELTDALSREENDLALEDESGHADGDRPGGGDLNSTSFSGQEQGDVTTPDQTVREHAPTRLNRSTFSLPPHVLDRLRRHMTERAFAAGEHLMRQGDPGDSLIVVLSGEVEISTTDESGQRHEIARSRGAQVLGEMALLTDLPRTADVQAITPVEALALPAVRFHELAKQYPVISQVLTQVISRRLGQPGRHDVLFGKTFDGYRIIRRLGRGGMGVVYQAEELATGRCVALKMMSHRLVYEPGAREQFQREADIIQQFDHPNIVRVHGRFAAFHTWFMVMDFCDGLTLDRLMRRVGPLPEETVRKIVGQVAAALGYAHAADIVHRDVKPSNIILDREGKVLLMDFGLARPVGDSEPAVDTLIIGTPRYMAPEQLRGEIGKAADLFALGCVAYELLTGKPLIPAGRISSVRKCHATAAPLQLKRLPDLSPDMSSFLDTCLSPNPEERRVDLHAVAAWGAPVILTIPPRRSPGGSEEA